MITFFCYNYGGTNFGGVTDAHRKMRKSEVFCDTLCAPRQFQVRCAQVIVQKFDFCEPEVADSRANRL